MANIMVIDDEALLLDLISNTLRLDGNTVISMSDPLAAIDYLNSGQPVVDLLLTDIDMKPISGFELVKRLVKNDFGSPVVFLSGYSGLSAAVTDSLGVRSLLEKPFTAKELRAVVRNSLARVKPKSTRAA
jgi:two-component system OmpR family response regulator